MPEWLQTILIVFGWAFICYIVLVPFVEWIDKVKKEMGEEDHYDD